MKINGKVIVVLFVVIFASFLIYKEKHREQALKKTLRTYAIVTKEPYYGAKIPLSIKFSYQNQQGKSKIIAREIGENCSSLKKGDTIYVKYSLTDNGVAEIIHCYWNDKLLEDMNNQ